MKERNDYKMPESIYEQTLCQESGYKVTLLCWSNEPSRRKP